MDCLIKDFPLFKCSLSEYGSTFRYLIIGTFFLLTSFTLRKTWRWLEARGRICIALVLFYLLCLFAFPFLYSFPFSKTSVLHRLIQGAEPGKLVHLLIGIIKVYHHLTQICLRFVVFIQIMLVIGSSHAVINFGTSFN